MFLFCCDDHDIRANLQLCKNPDFVPIRDILALDLHYYLEPFLKIYKHQILEGLNLHRERVRIKNKNLDSNTTF